MNLLHCSFDMFKEETVQNKIIFHKQEKSFSVKADFDA